MQGGRTHTFEINGLMHTRSIIHRINQLLPQLVKKKKKPSVTVLECLYRKKTLSILKITNKKISRYSHECVTPDVSDDKSCITHKVRTIRITLTSFNFYSENC